MRKAIRYRAIYVGQHNFGVHENTVYVRGIFELFALEFEVGADEAPFMRMD
jgi:hypothetical protein